MRMFFLLCAAFALCIATANPAPDIKQESPEEPVPVQRNKTGEMKRGEPLHKVAGRMTIWKEGLTAPPYYYGGNCPPEFREYWGRCFGFFVNPAAWIDAEKHCWLYGTNLASIHDQWEYDFLYNLMKETGYYGPAWVGANDAVRAGDLLWSDGSVSDVESWAPNLPNSWIRWRRCLSITSDDYLRLGRGYCGEPHAFICGTRPGSC